MKLKFFLLLFGLFPSLVFSQNLTQNIRGKVYDRDSEISLPGATIVVISSSPVIGTSSNLDGRFALKDVPIGRHDIKVSFLGYEDVILSNLLLGSAKELILSIGLSESYQVLDEVVISASKSKQEVNNDMVTVSARSFSTDETSRFAASVDDPARMALSFAGVSTTNDVSNEIIIRGNSPLGLLWRMNGIEIPSPNHFTESGATGGGISALSINMLDNSDFLTGAFPAEYGNATSGVFDVKLRNGNNQQKEYAFQLGVLGTDISLEGPFKQGYAGSYLINYRYSTLSVLTDLGILDTGGDDNLFQDLAFQFNLPSGQKTIWKIFGLGGLSNSVGRPTDKEIKENPTQDFRDDDFVSNMGVGGISIQHFLSDQTYLKSIFSYSRQKIGYQADSINPFTLSRNRFYKDQYINDAARFNFFVNKKFNPKHSIRTGFIASRLMYDLYAKGEDQIGENRILIEDKGSANEIQAYTQWKYRFLENWTLNAGVHALYFELNNKSSIEPRIGLQFKINEMKSLSFGFGLHSKLAPLMLYNSKILDQNGVISRANKFLNISKAFHYVLGYDQQLSEELRLKVEVYYQRLFNVPVVDQPLSSSSGVNYTSGRVDHILSDKGTGDNIGAEITFERSFSQGFYYLFTASLFDSKYQMPDGREFSSKFNTNYIFTILGGKEYLIGKEDKNLLGLNLKILWTGGNRYRPVDLEKSVFAGETVYDEKRGYSEQAPDYYRLDITFSYRINKSKLAHIISLQAQNTTNRLNVFDEYYDKNSKTIETNYQFGVIPVLKYRVEF